jgi:hypothetical protein
MIDRAADGFVADRRREQQDRLEAKAILASVIADMIDQNKGLEAVRLHLAGSAGYPGMDELFHLPACSKGALR